MQFLAISLLQRIITQSRDSAVRREKGIISNFLCIRIREMAIAKQPYSVIGNTPDFDSVFPGSSPGRATLPLSEAYLPHELRLPLASGVF